MVVVRAIYYYYIIIYRRDFFLQIHVNSRIDLLLLLFFHSPSPFFFSRSREKERFIKLRFSLEFLEFLTEKKSEN